MMRTRRGLVVLTTTQTQQTYGLLPQFQPQSQPPPRQFQQQQRRTMMAKKSAKKKKPSALAAASGLSAGGRDKNLELILDSLDAPVKQEPKPIPAEEMARRYEIGRNYVIGMFRDHNEIHHDLACKIQMKQHAVKMLPRNYLKDEAMKIDNSGPPVWRHIAEWTPPIPNFQPEDFMTDAEQQQQQQR
jgi:hypothetical protein